MGLTNSRNEVITTLQARLDQARISLRHYEDIIDLVRTYNVAGPDGSEVRGDVISMIQIRIQRIELIVRKTEQDLNDFLVRA